MEKHPTIPEKLLQVVVARYGAHITPEQSGLVQHHLEQLERTARALRAYPLSNADEPALLFTPCRIEGD